MEQVNYTVEDSLELLVGLRKTVLFDLEKSDVSFLSSIARQTFKGVALTDRQCNVVKEKLLKYKEQFIKEEYNIDLALTNLRMPLRDIDRSKFIKLIDGAPLSYPNEKWIRIRFPFSKKLIAELDHMLRLFNLEYNHSKGSHEHHFKLTERAVFELVSRFQSRQFILNLKKLNQIKI